MSRALTAIALCALLSGCYTYAPFDSEGATRGRAREPPVRAGGRADRPVTRQRRRTGAGGPRRRRPGGYADLGGAYRPRGDGDGAAGAVSSG